MVPLGGLLLLNVALSTGEGSLRGICTGGRKESLASWRSWLIRRKTEIGELSMVGWVVGMDAGVVVVSGNSHTLGSLGFWSAGGGPKAVAKSGSLMR